MKLEFTKRAVLELERKMQRWQAKADYPDLFEEELAAALERIRTAPTAGQPYETSRGLAVRRVAMPKTANHVYYRIDGADLVRVLCVWRQHRRQGPRLG